MGPVQSLATVTVLGTFPMGFATKLAQHHFAANLLPISAAAAEAEMKSPNELAVSAKRLPHARYVSRIHLRRRNALPHHQHRRFGQLLITGTSMHWRVPATAEAVIAVIGSSEKVQKQIQT